MKVTVQEVIDDLNRLACLGNGDTRGNSLGNDIAGAMLDRIRAHGIASPDGYVPVPIEPTSEMIRAAEEAYIPFGDMGMALICGNLAAPKQENSND